MKQTIKSFSDLVAWQEGHKFALDIYQLTKGFPKEELFGLTNQIRRAAVSVTSNIAEGFSRKSTKEKCQFYYISIGSVAEVQSQILMARDLGYVSNEKFDTTAQQSINLNKLIHGLIKSAKLL